uniref:Uncharacterized protein n=1 Tax=Rhizophora mucronata TaxID=61149 RepID=A0A2P2R4Q0_RHIMU
MCSFVLGFKDCLFNYCFDLIFWDLMKSKNLFYCLCVWSTCISSAMHWDALFSLVTPFSRRLENLCALCFYLLVHFG